MDTLNILNDSLSQMLEKIPGLLQENVSNLETIKRNTGWDFVDDGMNLLALISIGIALIALFFEVVTWFGITGTRQSIINESEKNRVDKECQYRLFQDIIRHLYRNKICILTMQVKSYVMQNNFEKELKENSDRNNDSVQRLKFFYPSEEHILKLKLMPSDIHLEEYYRDVETYHKLHEVELLLRNYNIEVDTAFFHLPNPKVDAKTRERDFSTLNFKTGFLTSEIIGLMNIMWPDKNNQSDAQGIIFAAQEKNVHNNEIDPLVYDCGYYDKVKELISKESADWYITEIFNTPDIADEFLTKLTNDILIECGTNSKKEEKIHIVSLDI